MLAHWPLILLTLWPAIPAAAQNSPRIEAGVLPPTPPTLSQRATEGPETADFALEGAVSQGGVVLGTAPAGTTALTLDGKPIPLAKDGRFLIAFGRDFGTSAELVATTVAGRTLRQTLSVAPRAWRIENLSTLPKVSQPSAEFQRRRPPELARINAARSVDHDVDGWRQRFLWPARGRISGLFGAQRIYRGEPGSFHSGVDVAGGAGAPVVAPADGVVTLAAESDFTLEGRLLMLDHGMGLNSAFLHLSKIDVKEGDVVRRGQKIGEIGSTGRATGPHLHWSMKWRDARIDPLLLAGPMAR
ncbi:murein DD-endopeptidase MepM/ murein hydrolase activator NlpD [Sphingomonas zeicaulis]|uniref:M23 family metallopeptidase n=1 Tax=Sphingomonas zeicaulis TaxID=1632740 RepID=UPI003D1FEEDD